MESDPYLSELVVGALVSAFLEPVVEKLTSVVVDLFRGKDEAIPKLVEELRAKMSMADLLLVEAEEKLITDDTVRQWLDDLKDTIYGADDLIYMIETETLRKELTNKVLKYIPTPYSSFDNAKKHELEETIRRLNLCLEGKELGFERLKRMKLPERECAPLLEDQDVYGRDASKEEIIELLLMDDTAGGDNFSVVPIVGMGGIGKTTLAQFVFKDERVSRRFDTTAWITVGDDKLDCSKVMRLIVEKVTERKCVIKESRDLQEEVKKSLIGKKFLFVLDDVWDESPAYWDVLSKSFKAGLQGSKIIVTTRITNVALVMKAGAVYNLKPLSDSDSWELFVNHAFFNADVNEYSDLQDCGKKIVDKCKGLPLAIKSIGDLLRGTHIKGDWESILNNDIWELYEKKKITILPALWLSYLYLPSKLKQCFAYCSLFCKDYPFNKEEMILLWIGEGLLHSRNGKRVEEVGEEYFQELISKSFFQPSSVEVGEEEQPTFLMHDLIHDLAMFVSGEFFSTMNSNNKCSHKVRHFSRMPELGQTNDREEFEGLSNAKCLRTLLLFYRYDANEVRLLKIEHLHKSFPRLRVLYIRDYEISKNIYTIGNLKYLRYLKLEGCKIKRIPDRICHLFNLETLLLENCRRITRLPTKIGNLIKLRHLRIPFNALKEMPLEFGKLKKLRTLNNFVVGKNKDCGIKLLKEFHDLHGSLCIEGLKKVSSVEEASDAALKSKRFLSQLHLRWRPHEAEDLLDEREVLGALEPPPNLKELTIENYKGSSFPKWIGDHRWLTNLVTLVIRNNRNCRFLPSLGQLNSLKYLHIFGFVVVERIGSEFYYPTNVDSSVTTKSSFRSLEKLELYVMWQLQEWSLIEGGIFPCLKSLDLKYCERLKMSLSAYYVPSLRELHIDNNDQLTPLLVQRAQLVQTPLSLKKITIANCKNLMHLNKEAFQHLTLLETLLIKDCGNLRCLPKNLPTSLSDLHISGCDLLTPRLQRETGEDWPIIAHIPNITINGEKI